MDLLLPIHRNPMRRSYRFVSFKALEVSTSVVEKSCLGLLTLSLSLPFFSDLLLTYLLTLLVPPVPSSLALAPEFC